MKQYQENFKRYEIKYLMNDRKYKLLRQKLRDNLAVDHYGKSNICNIYFDTPDYRLVRASLEKPVYKEKLRLRSYGIPAEGEMVFIELKKKYNGIVYKRREKLELLTAEHYLYDSEPVLRSSQIMKEIDWFIRFYQELIPAMYISYNRTALTGIENPSLRVTFDSNLIWRKEELLLENGSWGEPLLEEGWRLMEVKIPGSMPLWLSHILDELEIFPVSFSKYGKGYEQLIKQERIGLQPELFTTNKNIRKKGEMIYA